MREVDQVSGLGHHAGQVGWIAFRVNGPLDRSAQIALADFAAIATAEVGEMHPGQRGCLAGIHDRVGHITGGIVHADIIRLDARLDKLIEQGKRHGRGDKAVVLKAAVALAAIQVGFDGDFLAGPIPAGLAMLGLEMREQRLPGSRVAGLAGQLAQRVREHFVNQVLIRELLVPPKVAQAVPHSGLRIVHPDHPSWKDASPYAKNIIGRRCKLGGFYSLGGFCKPGRFGRRLWTACAEQRLAGQRTGRHGGNLQKITAGKMSHFGSLL